MQRLKIIRLMQKLAVFTQYVSRKTIQFDIQSVLITLIKVYSNLSGRSFSKSTVSPLFTMRAKIVFASSSVFAGNTF